MYEKNSIVSIIVPMYNSSAHIRCCLDSVFNQSYKNIEVVVIDDGSTDNSAQIVEEEYKSVSLIRQKNSGQGVARNVGIKSSRGKYLCFIDSDDFIKEEFISSMLDILIMDNEIDIVVCGIERHCNGSIIKDKLIRKGKIDGKTALVCVNPGPTNKMFKRETFEKVKFYEERHRYEDLATFVDYTMNIDSIFVLDDYLYCYNIYEGSSMRKTDDKINDIFYILKYIVELKNDEFGDEIDFLIIKHGILGHLSRAMFGSRREIKEAVNRSRQFVNENVDNYWDNKYVKNNGTWWVRLGVYLFKRRIILYPLILARRFEHITRK